METKKLPLGVNKIYLEQYMNEITVMAKDDEGYKWYICTIREGDPIILHTALPRDFFIPVDKNGCVETYKEP